ncbi:MAG TPA: hypothetical protein VNY52_01095 [Solirubrobacteraceae bacterium]|jgi:hypothetical protein|nr:hypothetical protein [Solirubrobacteraceae bacterium]
MQSSIHPHHIQRDHRDRSDLTLGRPRFEPLLAGDAEQAVDLLSRLTAHADTQPDTASLAALADQLDQLIATANPEQAKELLRLLIKDIRVHDQHTIIPTYRVPAAVRTMHGTVERAERCANPCCCARSR